MKNFTSPLYSLILLGSVASISSGEPGSKSGGNIQQEVSYTNDIQPVVKNFCTTCHAGDDPEGDMVLTSYEAVKEQVEHGELLGRINDPDDPMPEDGLIPPHLRRLFTAWSETGYLNKGTVQKSKTMEYQKFTPPAIDPIDVTKEGFELLELMQGHWVGPMKLMGTDYDWMAFDYRPISPSHVHGIFEGGSMGNLFTSFFVTKYKGKQTIMARNGGLLNGIYRTSYFVLNEVKSTWKGKRFQLVDAYGGKDIMWMELIFSGKKMEFNSYTSRFGLSEPKLHMNFKAVRKRPELAAAAAKATGFPKNVIDFPMPDPLPKPTWADVEYPHSSASYLYEERDKSKSLIEMAKISRDPRTIEQTPHLSKLTVSIQRTELTKGKKLHVYLSQKAFTDEHGKFITRGNSVRMDLLDTLLSFPELNTKAEEFTFTYLHPGEYFLTVIADLNGDGYPSPGDISHPATAIVVEPEAHAKVAIENLTVQN